VEEFSKRREDAKRITELLTASQAVISPATPATAAADVDIDGESGGVGAAVSGSDPSDLFSSSQWTELL
jgi:hypothetical protein